MSILADTMTRFAEHYHARRDLVAEQRGWDCVVVLAATDATERVTVRVADGRIAGIDAGEQPAQLVIQADLQTLCDVLELRRGPNEPYLFGELTVRGEEADFVRLDYIAEALCPQ
jgi:hypothetical protein